MIWVIQSLNPSTILLIFAKTFTKITEKISELNLLMEVLAFLLTFKNIYPILNNKICHLQILDPTKNKRKESLLREPQTIQRVYGTRNLIPKVLEYGSRRVAIRYNTSWDKIQTKRGKLKRKSLISILLETH